MAQSADLLPGAEICVFRERLRKERFGKQLSECTADAFAGDRRNPREAAERKGSGGLHLEHASRLKAVMSPSIAWRLLLRYSYLQLTAAEVLAKLHPPLLGGSRLDGDAHSLFRKLAGRMRQIKWQAQPPLVLEVGSPMAASGRFRSLMPASRLHVWADWHMRLGTAAWLLRSGMRVLEHRQSLLATGTVRLNCCSTGLSCSGR